MGFDNQFIISIISVALSMAIFFFYLAIMWAPRTQCAAALRAGEFSSVECSIEFNLPDTKTFKNKCSFTFINVIE